MTVDIPFNKVHGEVKVNDTNKQQLQFNKICSIFSHYGNQVVAMTDFETCMTIINLNISQWCG